MTPKYCELHFVARGRQIVLGYFLCLELQKLLIGCLSGAFIYEFLKSLKILSVYESIKIFLVRETVHVCPPWSVRRLGSSQSEVQPNCITMNCY
jgi:hypothetical protein